jgi:hypothetical protein
MPEPSQPALVRRLLASYETLRKDLAEKVVPLHAHRRLVEVETALRASTGAATVEAALAEARRLRDAAPPPR